MFYIRGKDVPTEGCTALRFELTRCDGVDACCAVLKGSRHQGRR